MFLHSWQWHKSKLSFRAIGNISVNSASLGHCPPWLGIWLLTCQSWPLWTTISYTSGLEAFTYAGQGSETKATTDTFPHIYWYQGIKQFWMQKRGNITGLLWHLIEKHIFKQNSNLLFDKEAWIIVVFYITVLSFC